jgi:hypothetical protein
LTAKVTPEIEKILIQIAADTEVAYKPELAYDDIFNKVSHVDANILERSLRKRRINTQSGDCNGLINYFT